MTFWTVATYLYIKPELALKIRYIFQPNVKLLMTLFYFIILHYIILYKTVLYHIRLDYIVLYYVILYYTSSYYCLSYHIKSHHIIIYQNVTNELDQMTF